MILQNRTPSHKKLQGKVQNNIRLSVIIPMFQSEKCISECIKSVCCQKIKDMEILCVDDGSDDRTGKIVLQLSHSDPRIRLISSEHGGVSRARNIGIAHAQGTYLLFLDADDKLYKRRLATVLKKAEREKADILVFSGATDSPYSTPIWIRDAFSAPNKSYASFSPEMFLTERSCRPSACNKLYNRSTIVHKGLWFPEGLALAEDHVFQFMVFPEAHGIVFSRCRLYCYRTHQTKSATDYYGQHEAERRTAHFDAMHIVYSYWNQMGYLASESYRRVYLSCYLQLLFGEIEKDILGEAIQAADLMYKDLLPLEDVWDEAGEQMEIISLLHQREIEKAKEKVTSYHEQPGEVGLLAKLGGTLRYAKRIGLHSAVEHYIGRIFGTEPR